MKTRGAFDQAWRCTSMLSAVIEQPTGPRRSVADLAADTVIADN
jgi:hypothetical protein